MRRSDEAYGALDEAAALAVATGDERLGVAARLYRARAQLAAGSPAVELDAVIADGQRLAMPGLCVTALAIQARMALSAGDLPGALDRSTRALALRDQHQGIEEDEAEVFLVHAEALSANGQPDAARAVLERGRRRLYEVADGISDVSWRQRYLDGVAAHCQLVATGKDPDAL